SCRWHPLHRRWALSARNARRGAADRGAHGAARHARARVARRRPPGRGRCAGGRDASRGASGTGIGACRVTPRLDWRAVSWLQDYAELLVLLSNSLIAGAVLGLVGGLVGVFVMQRDLAFAVHEVSELSFSGAAAALLFGGSVVAGSLAGALVAAVLIGLLGAK